MSALGELQRKMAGAIMRPLTADDAMQPQDANGRLMSDAAADFIKPNDRLTSFDRLEIYNRQYWYRLIDCFYDDYPGLRAVLGERKFRSLTVAYLERHPSRSFTLRDLGRDLVSFLESEPQWTKPHTTLALDMARLEWAQTEAFDGETRQVITTDDLLGLEPESIRLPLQPYITLLELNYPVDELLIAVKREDDELRGEASNAVTQHERKKRSRVPRPKQERVFIAVHRWEDSVYYKRLIEAQFALLRALRDGASLAQACERCLGAERDWSEDVRTWFETWTAFGWFCRSSPA